MSINIYGYGNGACVPPIIPKTPSAEEMSLQAVIDMARQLVLQHNVPPGVAFTRAEAFFRCAETRVQELKAFEAERLEGEEETS